MDTATALDLLGLTAADLVFRGTFRGQPFLDSWLSARPLADGGWDLCSTARVDARVLGSPVPEQTIDLQVRLGPDGRPLQATRQAGSKTLAVDLALGKAILPDGSRQPVASAGCRFVLENNHPGLLALLLALAPETRHGQPAAVFLLSALASVPYRLADAGAGVLLSDFGETLHFDARQCLSRIAAADGAILIDRMDGAAPPRPVQAADKPAGPPAYVMPADLAARAEDLQISVPRQGRLSATLIRPGRPSAAGVLVLQGSGEVDRNGLAAGIDTGTAAFADALARQGLAVLRADKQGVGQSRRKDGSLGTAGFQGAVDDAAAALSLLRARTAPGVPVLVLGHSLGGLIALSLSVERHHGGLPLVLLATPGRPLADVIRAQTLDQGRRLGLSRATLSRQLDDLDHFLAYARGEVPEDKARATALAGRLARPFMAEIAGLDPAALMQRQKAPVLVLQGGRDVQVDAGADFSALSQAAIDAGVPCLSRLFPDLNHLFRKVGADEGLEAYTRPAPVDPGAVEQVVDWCLQQAQARQG